MKRHPAKSRKIQTLHFLAVFTVCLTPELSASAPTAADCNNLATILIDNTIITSASVIPADNGLPEYCRVQGHIDSEIGFEVRLPTIWNGKLYFAGVGGAAGIILPPGPGLVRGYAETTTDTGHQGGPPIPILDDTWALNNNERQVNYAYAAVHVTSAVSKQIVQQFYGRMPEHSYFEGCSNGGRQGLVEAQRYPGDFDGIIAGAPALDFTGFMTDWNWNMQAMKLAPLPASKIPVIAAGVLKECDARDGLRDGLISDPRRCRFNPRKLQCPAGDGPSCLTSDQVQVLEKIYNGPVNSAENRLYPGLPHGHEDGADGWLLWVTGDGTIPPFQFIAEDQYLRFFVFGPAFNTLTFNFDTDSARLVPTGELLNATNPDLSSFMRAGGKLIMWHGWADPALTPFRTVQYFYDIGEALGDDASKVLRLFMAPGVHHCGGGSGPDSFDMLTPLENWVEHGIAPKRIVASHRTDNAVDRTRPLCPYPQEARYMGRGSIDDAENFVCRPRFGDDVQK